MATRQWRQDNGDKTMATRQWRQDNGDKTRQCKIHLFAIFLYI
jgi:hypothetical protein